jgi:hypothetical protein
MAKAVFNKKIIFIKEHWTYVKAGTNKSATFGAQLCMVLKSATIWEVDLKYFKSFEMSCWRRM